MHSTPPHYSKLDHGVSIQACWQHSIRVLAHAGIDAASARQETSLLLQHVMRQSLTELLCNLQHRPSREQLMQLEECLTRRTQREPIQYILGYTYFCGRRFAVDTRVLIPRQESEVLIEVARDVCHWPPLSGTPLRLADIGTGSGAIAVTLACDLPTAHILGIDISREALQVARTNIERHSVSERVSLVQGNLASMVGVTFDMVVANLPYVHSKHLPHLSPEITRFEPHTALDGGSTGLSLIFRLLTQAPGLLRAGGWLLLEVGDTQAGDVVRNLAQQSHWGSIATATDVAGAQRVVAIQRSGGSVASTNAAPVT